MAKLRKKGQSGTKKNFINRDKAIRKLQLNLKDFRRLCILKGIYPVEPNKKSKITKSSKKKTYYLVKDIKYLSHEPIIWKFWEFKTYLRRITRCKGRGEYDLLNQKAKNKPFIKLDHIIKDRYPKFVDALRDIDDALCMCFLYANLTKSERLPAQVIQYSKRLTSEFMHYVIESQSLRKVFISIKGIYYQAEIMGQKITFIVPHKFTFIEQADIDYSVMRTFTEFYITLLGFVNFKLLTSANFYYPPKVVLPQNHREKINYTFGNSKIDKDDENLACLNRPLLRSKDADIIKEDEKLEYFEDDDDQLSYHKLVKFQNLFKGLKIFISREVPRESLVFIIRSFAGKVSWDKTLNIGSTFEEGDETITHQIVDREKVHKKYLNRHYIQPQWIYDSVNAKKLLPVDDYFAGVTLPPHLSPFVEEKEGDYVPPEKEALIKHGRLRVESDKKNEADEIENSDADADDDENINETETNEKTSNETAIIVKEGKVEKQNLNEIKNQQKFEEKKLAEMMIPKKKKRLYHKIIKSQKYKKAEVENLRNKRKLIDGKK